MSKRVTLALLSTFVIAAVTIGSVAYASMRTSVTVSIDGSDKHVSTFGDTVSDVLHEQGITIGPHDAVAPDPDTAITDGSEIAVSYGRQLTIRQDGQTHTYWTTATNVDEAVPAPALVYLVMAVAFAFLLWLLWLS